MQARVTGRTRWAALLITSVSVATMPLAAQPADTTARRGSDERGALRLSGGGDVSLTLGGYLQVDGRWISGAASRQPDGLLLRRARLVFDAAMPDGWHVRLQPDFGQGRVLVQDAFVGREQAHYALRLGRFRPAFGTERMQSSSTLLAPERGIVNSLMPSRSFGAQVAITAGSWRVTAGGFRTPIGTDAVPLDTDGDVAAVAGSGHDLLLRVARQRTWRDRYVEWQAGVLAGRERGTLEAPALARVLTVAQQPLLVFRSDGSPEGTIRAAGARIRASTGLLAGTRTGVVAIEGAWLQQEVMHDRRSHRPIIGGAMIRLAHVWRGERLRSQEIVPHAGRGAWELGVRAGAVGAWGDALSALLVTGSATHARTGGVAASWLPSMLTRLTLAVDVTTRRTVVTDHLEGRRGTPPREHALLVRWQQGF